MTFLQWLQKHPQRTSGFLIQFFGAVQMVMVPFQVKLDPLTNGVITAVLGGIVSLLAWTHKNTKDEA
jgi:hypothetical protein